MDVTFHAALRSDGSSSATSTVMTELVSIGKTPRISAVTGDPARPEPPQRHRKTTSLAGLGAKPRWCLDVGMTDHHDVPRVVSASREIAASTERIFELIADPAPQPRWDGNGNLAEAAAGQRIRNVGEVFTMTLTGDGAVRENHVVEFEEGRRLAWRPAQPGQRPPGHLWRWELEPIDDSRTNVTHTYDWSQLTDEKRLARARATTDAKLLASLNRLAALAEE